MIENVLEPMIEIDIAIEEMDVNIIVAINIGIVIIEDHNHHVLVDVLDHDRVHQNRKKVAVPFLNI
ncbi:hypothetical protein BLA29_008620 [Euroglyphus maynei]|uniref:Uncharacterized protein n=1 Tax=Euroglyphus maynei TaxID=6958 RepID=A0A1Y3BSE3_EURMA|nr:hypothetical protein BLA29_008620 [Euroglyphus maynei]